MQHYGLESWVGQRGSRPSHQRITIRIEWMRTLGVYRPFKFLDRTPPGPAERDVLIRGGCFAVEGRVSQVHRAVVTSI